MGGRGGRRERKGEGEEGGGRGGGRERRGEGEEGGGRGLQWKVTSKHVGTKGCSAKLYNSNKSKVDHFCITKILPTNIIISH